MNPNNTEQDAFKNLDESVANVIGKSWLGIVAHVDDSGQLHVARTTWEFPKDKFMTLLALLAADFDKETSVSVAIQKVFPLDDFAALQKRLKENARKNQVQEVPVRDDDPVHLSLTDAVGEAMAEGDDV